MDTNIALQGIAPKAIIVTHQQQKLYYHSAGKYCYCSCFTCSHRYITYSHWEFKLGEVYNVYACFLKRNFSLTKKFNSFYVPEYLCLQNFISFPSQIYYSFLSNHFEINSFKGMSCICKRNRGATTVANVISISHTR